MCIIKFRIWFTIICGGILVYSRTYPECDSIEKFHTYIASRESCAKYIFCDGEDSFEGACLGDNYFNEIEGNCDDRDAVDCPLDPKVDENAITIDVEDNNNNGNSFNNIPSNSQSNSENNFEGNEINGNHNNLPFLNTENMVAPNPTIPLIQDPFHFPGLFNPVTTPNLANEIPFNLPSICPPSSSNANLIYLPNPTSCSSYYTCYNGVPIPMICPQHMYFNTQSGKCERQENVYCALDRPVRLQCTRGVYDFMPHPRNCDYYYFCSNGFLMIFQCPFKYTWHYERRSCVHESQSKCFTNTAVQELLLK